MSVVERHMLLMDPQWRPGADDEVPPAHAVAGSWPVGADGEIGGFRPNPGYEPADPEAPADPLDALLRTGVHEPPPVELVQLLLRDALLDIAVGEDGSPLVVYSPDEVLCVLVATSAPQRDLVEVPGWRRADLLGLIGLLEDGVDVLVNPYGPVPARLAADDVRGAWLLAGDELDQARAHLRERHPPRPTGLVPWNGWPSGQADGDVRADGGV